MDIHLAHCFLYRVVESLIVGQMAKMDATLADISKIDQTVKNVKAKLDRLSRDKVQYLGLVSSSCICAFSIQKLASPEAVS